MKTQLNTTASLASTRGRQAPRAPGRCAFGPQGSRGAEGDRVGPDDAGLAVREDAREVRDVDVVVRRLGADVGDVAHDAAERLPLGEGGVVGRLGLGELPRLDPGPAREDLDALRELPRRDVARGRADARALELRRR